MASALDAQPETTRLLRIHGLESIEAPSLVCDVAVRHRAPNSGRGYQRFGLYYRMPLMAANTLSRLEPGDYEVHFRHCEPATHRLVPARLRFHVPEPPSDHYNDGRAPPLPANPSYEEVGPIKLVEQSQLRRALASASATAAAVGPAVGSVAFTLLLTLLAVAAAALLMGRGPGGPVQEEEEEGQGEKERRAAAKEEEEEEEEQAAVVAAKGGEKAAAGKSDRAAASSSSASSASKGAQIASTEEGEMGLLEVPNPAVELPKNDAEWREMFDKVYSSPSSAGGEEVAEAFAAKEGGPKAAERGMGAELEAETKEEEQPPPPPKQQQQQLQQPEPESEPQERGSASSAPSSSSSSASAPKQRRGSSSVRLSPESVAATGGGAARPPSAFPIDEASVEGRGSSSGKGEHRRQSLSWVEDYWGVPESGEGVDEAEAEQPGQPRDATAVAGVGSGEEEGEEEQGQGAEEQGVEEGSPLERSVSAEDHQQEREQEPKREAAGDKAASQEEEDDQ